MLSVATYPDKLRSQPKPSIIKWLDTPRCAARIKAALMRCPTLHCEVAIPGWHDTLHCVNVHLGLGGRGRMKQLQAIRDRIQEMVPAHAPLIIAGDFNDWRIKAGEFLARSLHVSEVFEHLQGVSAKSYPSAMPMLCLILTPAKFE